MAVKNKMHGKKTYSFTLVLADVPEITQQVEDALFEAGCDDTLLGNRDGVTYLDFDRDANNLQEALQSAIRDVRKAGFTAIRIEPDDLVNASEIARRVNRSRESVRQLVTGVRGPGGFPPPMSSVTKSSPLWRWTEVVKWFADKRITKEIAFVEAEAEAIRKINAILEMSRSVDNLSEVQRLWNILVGATRKTKISAHKLEAIRRRDTVLR
ncbi:MAG: hypothetical protein ABSE63_01665 [Thermoguttaceae bacterium]|jgi:hypothetical protein